jgi:aspartate/methionine/tyrosine aminotransferase
VAEQIMDALGCTYRKDQVGMFVWGKIPDALADVEQLTEKILHQAKVFITPGFIFGSNGARYVRISLCATQEKLTQALERVKSLKSQV